MYIRTKAVRFLLLSSVHFHRTERKTARSLTDRINCTKVRRHSLPRPPNWASLRQNLIRLRFLFCRAQGHPIVDALVWGGSLWLYNLSRNHYSSEHWVTYPQGRHSPLWEKLIILDCNVDCHRSIRLQSIKVEKLDGASNLWPCSDHHVAAAHIVICLWDSIFNFSFPNCINIVLNSRVHYELLRFNTVKDEWVLRWHWVNQRPCKDRLLSAKFVPM